MSRRAAKVERFWNEEGYNQVKSESTKLGDFFLLSVVMGLAGALVVTVILLGAAVFVNSIVTGALTFLWWLLFLPLAVYVLGFVPGGLYGMTSLPAKYMYKNDATYKYTSPNEVFYVCGLLWPFMMFTKSHDESAAIESVDPKKKYEVTITLADKIVAKSNPEYREVLAKRKEEAREQYTEYLERTIDKMRREQEELLR